MSIAPATLIFGLSLGLLAGLTFLYPPTADAEEKILGEDHWVTSVSAADGKPLKIYVWEKRLKDVDVKTFATTGRVVLLAHGATIPSRTAFDLQVPDKSELTYSLMDYLAERGLDVFAVEYQNYGRSGQHECGLCVTSQVAANDINAAVDYIRDLRGVQQVYLLGWSWGTVTTALFTMERPHKVKRLILYAPRVSRPLPPADKPPTTEFRTVTAEGLKGVFEPQATDAAVIDAFVQEVMKLPRAPNGAQMDVRVRLPVPMTDPRQMPVPTMIIMGDLDRTNPITQPDLPRYFADLPNSDKQFIIVPSAGHMLHLQKTRGRFFMEVTKWFGLDQPGWRMEITATARP
jgi:pimeloyl-ACP methyl ester carboxylesterase